VLANFLAYIVLQLQRLFHEGANAHACGRL